MALPPLQRILYVEDEEILQTVARMALTRLGPFTVETCGEGRLAAGHALAFRPDLILLDVVMPGLDGPATLETLKAEPALAGVPVVFMTARVQPEDIEGYRRQGAVDVIAKPFDPMTLAGRLRAIWERCHGGDRQPGGAGDRAGNVGQTETLHLEVD